MTAPSSLGLMRSLRGALARDGVLKDDLNLMCIVFKMLSVWMSEIYYKYILIRVHPLKRSVRACMCVCHLDLDQSITQLSEGRFG